MSSDPALERNMIYYVISTVLISPVVNELSLLFMYQYILQQLARIDISEVISARKWLLGEHYGMYGETNAVNVAMHYMQMMKKKQKNLQRSSIPLHSRFWKTRTGLNCSWPSLLAMRQVCFFLYQLRNMNSEIRCGDSIWKFKKAWYCQILRLREKLINFSFLRQCLQW